MASLRNVLGHCIFSSSSSSTYKLQPRTSFSSIRAILPSVWDSKNKFGVGECVPKDSLNLNAEFGELVSNRQSVTVLASCQ